MPGAYQACLVLLGSKSSPWITAEMRRKMRKRDFLKNQAVKQNSQQAWNDYKKARNEVNASIREA